METTEVWAGEFGNAYHQRNWVDWQKRVPFFKHILEVTGARSIFEFGCGPGWNLSACKRVFPEIEAFGLEINEEAQDQAVMAGLDVWEEMRHIPGKTELVFTAGCLIHIPPDQINATMQTLINHSRRYVMSIEYEAPEEKEIEYRGQSGLLWKRPYIEMYQEKGLVLLETGKLQEDVGFDNCTYGLFTKGSK